MAVHLNRSVNRGYNRSFSINHFFSALFNSLDDHLVIDGDFGVAVQLVDDTYSNHNPFHIEDYLLLKLKLGFIDFKIFLLPC